jgi:hypothetical protein
MKVNLERTTVSLDALELFGALPKEQKLEFVKLAMLFDDDVFLEVVDALAADEYCSPTFNDQIFKARLRLMDRLPEGLRDVVKKLLQDADVARSQMQQYRTYAWKLSHNWPFECEECKSRLPRKPDEPRFDYGSIAHPTEEEITAAMLPVNSGSIPGGPYERES